MLIPTSVLSIGEWLYIDPCFFVSFIIIFFNAVTLIPGNIKSLGQTIKV